MHVFSPLYIASLEISARSKEDYIIFHFGVHKALVPLPTSYQDACTVVCELFPTVLTAGSAITFETDELSICRGERVVIHQTAWDGVAKMLGNVYVNAADVKKDFKEEVAEHLDANTTIKHAVDSEDDFYPQRKPNSTSGQTNLFKSSKSTTSSKTKKPGEGTGTTSKKKGAFTPSKTKVVSGAKGKGTKADPLNLFPEESVKHGADSDADAEECAEVAGALETTPVPDDSEQQSANDDENEKGHGVFSGVGEKPPSTNKAAPRSNSNDTESSFVHVPQKIGTTAAPTLTSVPSVNTDASTTLPDRILVIVDHEQSDAPDMKFRVRPTITISRLLQAICKQFKLEYGNAHLHMLLDVEDGDDTAVERVFCPLGETLAALGASEGQRFVVGEFGQSS